MKSGVLLSVEFRLSSFEISLCSNRVAQMWTNLQILGTKLERFKLDQRTFENFKSVLSNLSALSRIALNLKVPNFKVENLNSRA